MPWIRGQTKQPAGKGTREKERERDRVSGKSRAMSVRQEGKSV